MAINFRSKLRNYTVSSSSQREELHFSANEFGWPLGFMLCCTMCGLKIYFAWLFVVAILVNRFINNKYDFIIMLTILGSSMSLIDLVDTMMPISSLIFIVSLLLLILFRKNGVMVRLTWWFFFYFIILLWLAHYSLESMRGQLPGIFRYMSVIAFIIPVGVFSGYEFDKRYFFKRIFVYAFLFAGFFMFDVCIMNGAFLLPRDPSWIFYEMASDIDQINIYPFSFIFPRRWPTPLYIYILCIFPLVRYYKMPFVKWLWMLIPIGLSRTFTFTFGLIITYIFCIGKIKQLLKYAAIGIAAFTVLYFIDGELPEYEGNSTLRIKSSVDQFLLLDLSKADDEDLAELGSTRGAQIIPKMEHLFSMGRQWKGFGFISRNSNIQAYTIENELYANPEMSEEVATGVESMPFQVILTIGFIGLIVIITFYLGISRILKNFPLCSYYNSVLFCLFVIGISGFGGWISPDTLYLLALTLGVVILDGRSTTQDFAPERPYSPTTLR